MRGFGFLLGFLLLIEGLPKIFNPRYWLSYSERNLRGRLPNEATRTISEFGKLSDDSIRAMALVEIFAGLLLVFMASALRFRPMMFRRGPGPWMMGNPGMMGGGPWMGWQGMGMKGGHMHPHSHEHSHSHVHQQAEGEQPGESL